jgi:hypothetical protein
MTWRAIAWQAASGGCGLQEGRLSVGTGGFVVNVIEPHHGNEGRLWRQLLHEDGTHHGTG